MFNEKLIFSKWNADLYDQNETGTDDVAFLLKIIGPVPQKVLEVSCGSGRILVPLAKAGHNVTGFDVDEFMLAKIAAKAEGLHNIAWWAADAVYDEWGAGYDVVVLAGNILYNIVSDIDYAKAQELLIRKAAAALAPGGHLYIDYQPGNHFIHKAKRTRGSGERVIWEGRDSDGNHGRMLLFGASYDPKTRLDSFTRRFELTLSTGETITQDIPAVKHFASLDQIRGWLCSADFSIEWECGDYEGNPIGRKNNRAILYAKYNLQLLREKDGIAVYRTKTGILKEFKREEHRRELRFYDVLQACDVPTLRVLARTETSLLLENLECSLQWRLGCAEDMDDPDIARAIAKWYRKLHAAGRDFPALHELPCETDVLTETNLRALAERYPSEDFWPDMFARFGDFRAMLDALPQTLTYNDFYWTNLAVTRDGKAALMFDYNVSGRGYVYGDLRNVMSSLNERAGQAFMEAYGPYDPREQAVDDVAAELYSLWVASQREKFPDWAKPALAKLRDGTLLCRLKRCV